MIALRKSRRLQPPREASFAHPTSCATYAKHILLVRKKWVMYKRMESFLDRRQHRNVNKRGTYEVRNSNAPCFISGGNAVIRFSRAACMVLLVLMAAAISVPAQSNAASILPAPVAVYEHAFPQDGISVSSPSNEKQSLADVDQMERLKKAGVRFDFDLLDAATFAPAGGYGIGHTTGWPDGPDSWIARCRAAGFRPGLRFPGNSIGLMQPVPAWKNSLAKDGRSLSLFEGGFLPDLIADMQSWYDRGIRLFEFESFDLTAATPASAKLTRDEIIARNTGALRDALAAFRSKNSDATLLIIADANPTAPAQPDASSAPTNLAAADLLGISPIFSTGEPRTSAQPEPSFRRSVDIATDDRVRRLEQSGVPLQQIDSDGFSAAEAGGASVSAQLPAWKGEFLLGMARGGWVNTVYGNLEPIQDSDARWMARVQKLFFTLQEQGSIHSFGGPPGAGQPYGFAGATAHGSVAVVVNPGQSAATLDLPAGSTDQGRVLFRDAGFLPKLSGDTIKLGPGQMAVVGFGAYAAPAFSFGVQEDVVIPSSIEPIQAAFQSTAPGTIEARIDPPIEGVLRVIVLADEPRGQISRNPSSDLAAQEASKPFVLQATQSGRPIPLRMSGSDGNSFVSDGASWAVAEIDVDDLTPGIPVRVSFQSNEKEPPTLEGRAYQVVY